MIYSITPDMIPADNGYGYAVIVKPGEQPIVQALASSNFDTPEAKNVKLAFLQSAVDGYIDCAARIPSPARPRQTLDVWCNDEGLLNGMTLGINLMSGRLEPGGCPLAGPILILSCDEAGNSSGLTRAEVESIQWTDAQCAIIEDVPTGRLSMTRDPMPMLFVGETARAGFQRRVRNAETSRARGIALMAALPTGALDDNDAPEGDDDVSE